MRWYFVSDCCITHWIFFFFLKQKTAYELRISDWSSDVCSADLADMIGGGDDEAVGIILFDHLEETVQDAAHFADIVAKAAGGADAVEFIEEIDAARAA